MDDVGGEGFCAEDPAGVVIVVAVGVVTAFGVAIEAEVEEEAGFGVNSAAAAAAAIDMGALPDGVFTDIAAVVDAAAAAAAPPIESAAGDALALALPDLGCERGCECCDARSPCDVCFCSSWSCCASSGMSWLARNESWDMSSSSR